MAENRLAAAARGGEASEVGTSGHEAANDGPISSASPEAQTTRIEALDRLRFDYIAEAFGYVASFANSAQEAAFRNDAQLLEARAKQTRAALVSALEVRRGLGSPEASR